MQQTHRSSSIVLMGLAHHKSSVARLGKRAEELMPGLLDPQRDVLVRAGVGRKHRDDPTDRDALDAPNQLEQRAGAKAATGIDLLVDRGRSYHAHDDPPQAGRRPRRSIAG